MGQIFSGDINTDFVPHPETGASEGFW